MATDPAGAPAPSAAPSAAPPAPPSPAPAARGPERVSAEAYERMDAATRYQYARQFDQTQFTGPAAAGYDAPAPDPVAPKPAVPGEPSPPAAVVDNTLKLGDFTLTPDDVATLFRQASENAIRATQLPASATDYRTELPATFRLPQGGEFRFDEASPELGALREWAHGQHFSQQQFSEMLSFHAAAKGREDSAFAAAVQRERDQLGAAATVRVDAVAQWIKGTLGEGHQDKAQALIRGLWSAKAVEGLELLASRFTTQGAANFSQAHRTPEPAPGGGRVSEEVYNRMTQAEKWEYARGFDQSQFRNNGGGSR
jgi:hypothetical protein